MKRLVVALAFFALSAFISPSLTLAQEIGACPMPYTVVPGDRLSDLAVRFLGDSQAYPQIVDATNRLDATDPTFTKIADPNSIAAGARVCIPDSPSAPAGLALSDLANATYKSDLVATGTATLTSGTFSAEAAPGSASRNTIQLFWIAYGSPGGVQTAAVVTWESGGGSGTFYNLHLMQIQNGKPFDSSTVLLGDRVIIRSVEFNGGAFVVSYLDRKPDEPMSALPTVLKTVSLPSGQPAAPQSGPSSLSGTYYEHLAGADSTSRTVMLSLASGGGAVLGTQSAGVHGPILEEGTWQDEGGHAKVHMTVMSGQPVLEDFVFAMQDDTLVAVQYPPGSAVQALALQREATGSLAGIYRQTEPAGDAPELVDALFLDPTGPAVMSSDYVGKLVRIDRGTWSQNASSVTVSFTQEDGNPSASTLVFELQGDKLVGPGSFALERLPATASITGTVTFAEHLGIPQDSVVTLRLVDVSIPNAAPIVLAESSFTTGGLSLPFPFDLKYDPTLIAFNHTYEVQATITVDGAVMFQNMAQSLVLTNGNPSEVNLQLDKVR